MGFEPMTSSLPRKCSTPELRRLVFSLQLPVCSLHISITANCLPPIAHLTQSGRRGSNSRPIAWKAIALPTELLPLINY
jgi:hypothetical protein